jgi:hypothetical protein
MAVILCSAMVVHASMHVCMAELQRGLDNNAGTTAAGGFCRSESSAAHMTVLQQEHDGCSMLNTLLALLS